MKIDDAPNVRNDQGYRDTLADYHTKLGEHLYDLGTIAQAIRADWDGPASNGFDTFRTKLMQWCQAGQNCLDGVRNVHQGIGRNYGDVARAGASNLSAGDPSTGTS